MFKNLHSVSLLEPRVHKKVRGFTLIELLVVIAIVAVLAVVVLLVLNPAELLRQARDSNRLSDLDTVRKGIALYMADVRTVVLGTPNDFGAAWCFATTSTGPAAAAGCGVFSASYNASTTHASSSFVRKVDDTGWVPVDFTQISSKPPFAVLPIDPVNSGNYYYAYAATSTGGGLFELTGNLESAKYSSLEATDGGVSSTVYEVGTGLNM
jgi:prepilin-type N-terminal cleavage/methylation domain-containing protein